MPTKSDPKEFDKFDEYKFFIDDTAKLSERRQGVTSTYITVNSAIIGLITFIISQSALNGLKLTLVSIPAIAAGITVCYFWYGLLMTYKRLLRFRFDQLEKMETGIKDCHQMYIKESKELYGKAKPEKKIEFTKLEARLPLLFGSLYALFLVGLIIAAF